MPEIVNVSAHGFWLLLDGVEYFLPFEKFPWFRSATRAQVKTVELLHSDHLYWPELDIDLSLEMIAEPGKYPLVYR